MARNDSKLKRFCKENSIGIPSGVLRPVLFIPFGIYLNIAVNHWNNIKKHPELQGGIYNPDIAAGEKVAAKWGKIGLYYSFAIWVPSVFISPPTTLIIAVVDSLVAVQLASATHHQTTYVPHSIGHCKGSGAHEFQRPPGANESFFDAAARLNMTTTDPFHMCKSFVEEWQYGIAISTIFFLLALINICCSTVICVKKYQECRHERNTFLKWAWSSLSETIKFTIVIVVGICYMPVLLFRLLPISIKSRVRLARRYGFKAGQGLEEKGEMQLKTLKRKLGAENRKEGYVARHPGEPTTLADFLGIYDMLVLVVKHLHYVDVLNLSLVSRYVREAVLPADGYAQRMIHFRMYACPHSGKKQCWVCTNQICRKCKHPRRLKFTTLHHHMDRCCLYCTKCYFETVHKHVQSSRPVGQDSRHCSCAPLTATPSRLQRLLFGDDLYLKDQSRFGDVARPICQNCNVLSDAELLEKRDGRTKRELKGGGKEELGDRCTSCKQVLASGPRWWVCKTCKMECRSLFHRSWGKKGGKTKDISGDQAV